MLTNLSDIDLKLLRVFVAVAEAQGVSAAQEALLMNQSTISTHLASLETRLGFRLCQRGRSGFRLTPKGERMLIACRSLFNAARDFTRVSQSLNGLLTGDLQIGLVDNLVSLPGNPADGRRAAEHHRRQRAQIQPRPQVAPGHQIRLFGIGAVNAHPSHRAYHQKVNHHNQQIEIHGYLHSVVIVIRGPDATAPPVGSVRRPQRAGSTHNISNSRLAASSAVLPERS